MIGCPCDVCQSDDPRDQRDRPGVLVAWDDPALTLDPKHITFNAAQKNRRQVLIDATPDLRHQALRAKLSYLDAVFITHSHVDHVFGLDDLRRFNAVMDAPLEVYAEPNTHAEMERMFQHIFQSHRNVNDSFVARLNPMTLEPAKPIVLHGATFTPLRLMHGRLPIVGFRVDFNGTSLAYCTDVSHIPPETYPLLENLDVLVIDALRYRHHPTHLTIDQALEVIDQLKPKQSFFTHIAHDVKHADLAQHLPRGVAPAYDGLCVTL